MVIIKTADDLRKMKAAGEISVGALKVAGDAVRAGVTTSYIDAKIHEYITGMGAVPSFLGYNGFPASACISVNNEVIHGIPSKRVIQEADIVSIDVGVLYEGFHGDNAATFAVGEISKENEKLIEVTKECLFRAVEAAKKGNRVGDISSAVQTCAEANGFSVIRDYVGHGVGRELHEKPEVPNFGSAGRGPRLVPGMTLAIEPMINAGERYIKILDNGWTVVTLDSRASAHFEMTVAITENETKILTDWRGVF
ncbi:MAG: type I methionyl aminopeptidase [Oscillospiraceae bacterium]|nr:type I methionyl aminopeptidase [Oscillospiraceae bacterium]